MTYISFSFLLLFAVTAAVYFVFPSKYQYIVLLAASYVFYFFANGGLPVYMAATTLIIFAGTNLMSGIDEKTKAYIKNTEDITREQKKAAKASAKSRKKVILTLMIIINLCLLSVFKYSKAFLGSFGIDFSFNLVFPLGISFYTFQSLGYSIDVFRGKVSAEKNVLKTALFVSYFPQIVEGPIGRFDRLAPQLFSEHRFSFEKCQKGFILILIGFVKKLVIADNLYVLVEGLISEYGKYDGFQIFVGIMLYGVQLYADFSGCMDIAMGFSRILGIQLDYNFKQPYFSQSVAEFWRRWHISLCLWFRDYLFYSLSMSKLMKNFGKKLKGKYPKAAVNLPIYISTMVVWSLTGLWHVASWPYVLWGVFNGIIMVFSLQFEGTYNTVKSKLHINDKSKIWQLFRIIRTYLIMTVLNFMCEFSTMGSFIDCVKRVCVNPLPHGFSPSYILPMLIDKGLPAILLIFVSCALLLVYDIGEEACGTGEVINKMCGRSWLIRGAVMLILSLLIIMMTHNSADFSGGFMYAQF